MAGMSDDLTQQIRTRLAGLAAAGVEWLPRVEDPIFVPAAAPTEPVAGPSADPDDPARRRQELTVLADRVRGCTRCPELAATRTQTVFGVGRELPATPSAMRSAA